MASDYDKLSDEDRKRVDSTAEAARRKYRISPSLKREYSESDYVKFVRDVYSRPEYFGQIDDFINPKASYRNF